MAQTVKHLPAVWETGFDPWVRKIPWRRKWQPTPVFLPGKSHGRRSLVGYSPWGRKESDTTERLHFSLFYALHGPASSRPLNLQKGQNISKRPTALVAVGGG